MKTKLTTLLIVVSSLFFASCLEDEQNSTRIEQAQQERLQKESVMQLGLPNVTNYQEKRILKSIIELRDQANLATYTYLVAEQTGKLIFLGESVGYGISSATQYTNPSALQQSSRGGGSWEFNVLPQADPNGLYSPASAEGTWVLMKDPKTSKVSPIYVEPRIIVSQFKLTAE